MFEAIALTATIWSGVGFMCLLTNIFVKYPFIEYPKRLKTKFKL